MSWNGPKGPASLRGTPHMIMTYVSNHYGIPMDRILFGTSDEPPQDDRCLLYARVNGDEMYSYVTVWLRKIGGNREWFKASSYDPDF